MLHRVPLNRAKCDFQHWGLRNTTQRTATTPQFHRHSAALADL